MSSYNYKRPSRKFSINTRINNMYNTPEHRRIRASIRNSISKGTINKKRKK